MLSEELEERENELSATVRRAEAQHNQNVNSLGLKLDQAIDRFKRLDSSLNGGTGDDGGSDGGGNVAVRIGERLEELDSQLNRAKDAKFLIICWQEVSQRGTLETLEDRKRRGKIVECASIARQLLRISARLNPDGAAVNGNAPNGVKKKPPGSKHPTKEIIEKFLENLEQDLLAKFDDYYRRPNYDGMRECAVTLKDFNDGASVIATYVNQHSFFIDRTNLVTDELAGDAETWERLQDPDAELPGVEPSLQSLVDEVKIVLQDESAIIKRAFPYYEDDKDNPITNAKTIFFDALNKTEDAAGDKPVWITETGWPYTGPDFGKAKATLENSKTFWDEVGCPLFGNVNT